MTHNVRNHYLSRILALCFPFIFAVLFSIPRQHEKKKKTTKMRVKQRSQKPKLLKFTREGRVRLQGGFCPPCPHAGYGPAVGLLSVG